MAGRTHEQTDAEIAVELYLSDDPVFVATEVADMIDMTRQGALERLKGMENGGLVESKLPGRDRVFWLTDDGRELARESIVEDRQQAGGQLDSQ